MVKIKETYVSPTTEALEMAYEASLMIASPNGGFGEDPSEDNRSGQDWGF